MDYIKVKPGADATGPRNAVSAGGRNSFRYSGYGHLAQRTTADELERARSALAYIGPLDHDVWVKVGMAFKNEFGEDGWPIFDEWSRQAENYDARENRARWISWRNGGGITVATLYGMARNRGWRDNGRFIVPEPGELEARARDSAAAEAKSRERRNAHAAEAAKKSKVLWSASRPLSLDHPYLRRKAIGPTETLREIDAEKAAEVLGYWPSANAERLHGCLFMVPIKTGGKLTSAQLIDGTGRKHFVAGGRIGGGYWAAQSLPEGDGAGRLILIGEGVATVLTALQAHPSELGVGALCNSNMPTVALQLQERYPRADIVLLADIDKTAGEPDTYAAKAAEAVGGRLAIPRFYEGPADDRKDINDLARVHGLDSVRRAIGAAGTSRHPETLQPKPSLKPASAVTLIQANSIEPVSVDWLWPSHLARGKVHILAGKPAAGKTTLAVALAAIVTTGGSWPDGSRSKIGRVVIWSGEDDPADTLVPRLMAAGADLSQVNFVSGVIEDSEARPFDPAKHMQALAEKLSGAPDVALLIVDPVVSAVSGDSHKNTEVRRALQPLSDLAASTHCVVLGITHFTKGTGGRDPVERLTGSLAFGAVARVVLVAAKTEDDSEDTDNKPSRIMTRAKSNIGPDGGGFRYDLEQKELEQHPGIVTSVVKWGEAVQGSARELLAEAEAMDSEEGGSVTRAADWLRDLLDDAALGPKDIEDKAKAAGIAWATIRRAKTRLGIKPRKQGMAGGWVWSFPEDAHETSKMPTSKR